MFMLSRTRICVSSIIFAMLVAFCASPVMATELNNEKSPEEIANIIQESTTFDNSSKSYSFDEKKAASLGLEKNQATQIDTYLENLSSKEASDLNEQGEIGTQAIPALIAWAAKVLAAAGLGWLAKELYDYGAEKFCEKFGDYNSVTERVCDVIG